MRQRPNARQQACSVARHLCCVALALLPACQPSGPNAPFAAYLSELSATLGVAAPQQRPSAPLTPPLAEALESRIPKNLIDSVDVLQLSDCAVQANIGKRQTSLGQFAKSSQRLFLELEYLRLAPACIHHLRDSNNATLADRLEVAWREKQALLPALVYNATLGSDEYRAFWLAVPAPGGYPPSRPEAVVAAMAAINDQTRRWLNGDYRVHNRDFELRLSEVAGGDAGIRLQDWSHQINWLSAADLVLEQRLATADSCYEHPRNRETGRHITAVHTHFTNVIQPLNTESQQRYLEATAPVDILETQLGTALPPLYRRWMEERDQQVAILTSASSRHLARLSNLRQLCTTQ